MEKNFKLFQPSSEQVRYACLNWHYAKRQPSSTVMSVGVSFHQRFIGVILFGLGANRMIDKFLGVPTCELTRVALCNHPGVFVSQIVSAAMKLLKGYDVVLSYADPAQGHAGSIYKAMNFTFLGDSSASRIYYIGGTQYHARSVSHAGQQIASTAVTSLPKKTFAIGLTRAGKKAVKKKHEAIARNADLTGLYDKT